MVQTFGQGQDLRWDRLGDGTVMRAQLVGHRIEDIGLWTIVPRAPTQGIGIVGSDDEHD